MYSNPQASSRYQRQFTPKIKKYSIQNLLFFQESDEDDEVDEETAERNMNAEKIAQADAARKEELKQAAMAKKAKDREDREKQKTQAEDRKKKAQEKAQKGERKR